MNVFVSGIAFNQDSHILIKKVNEKIVDMCNKNGKVLLIMEVYLIWIYA